ncbi:hypothetical protein, partial [Bacillus sp. MM2020_4]|uniref:hypothetical protein n=2 Tax=Bacillaceae TaxID=186817 RepID=UPI00140E09DB
VFELILGIFQRINLFGIKTWSIFEFIAANTASYYVDFNSDRVFGTIGNPVWFNFVMYGVCKLLHINTKKTIWMIFGFSFIILGFSRNIALFAILFEVLAVFFPIKSLKQLIDNVRKFLFISIPLLTIGVLVILSNEYTSRIIMSIFNSPNSDYSVSYRISMVNWLIESLNNPLFGDIWDNNLPQYIDMGYILTIKKFGIVGGGLQYIIFLLPIIFYRSFKDINQRISYIFISLFCLTSELTTVVVLNSVFIGHILLWVLLVETMRINRSKGKSV